MSKIERYAANAESNAFEDFLEELEPNFEEEVTTTRDTLNDLGDGLFNIL